MRASKWIVALGPLLLAGACSLNPQPLPPDTAEDSGTFNGARGPDGAASEDGSIFAEDAFVPAVDAALDAVPGPPGDACACDADAGGDAEPVDGAPEAAPVDAQGDALTE
jgi:hypothetical protein